MSARPAAYGGTTQTCSRTGRLTTGRSGSLPRRSGRWGSVDAYRLGVSGRWVVLVLAEESVLLAGHGCHDSLGLGARVDCRHGVGGRRESCEGEHRCDLQYGRRQVLGEGREGARKCRGSVCACADEPGAGEGKCRGSVCACADDKAVARANVGGACARVQMTRRWRGRLQSLAPKLLSVVGSTPRR